MQKNKENDKVEEIPIEEFAKDKQDCSADFQKKFKKSSKEIIKKGYESWL